MKGQDLGVPISNDTVQCASDGRPVCFQVLRCDCWVCLRTFPKVDLTMDATGRVKSRVRILLILG